MPMLSPDEPPSALSWLLPGIQIQRRIANALVSRAMLKLDSGDIEGAGADLLAVHRLARLMSQGPTLIERLVGAAVESQACKGDNGLAMSGRLSGSQARAYLAKLQALPTLPGMAECMDISGRFHGLAYVMFCQREGFEALSNYYSGGRKERIKFRWPNQIDWNEVLRIMNRWYDRLAEAAGKESFEERQEAFESITKDFDAVAIRPVNKQKQSSGLLWEILNELGIDVGGDRVPYPRTTSEAGNRIIGLLFPSSLGRASAQCDIAVMRLQMSKVMMALAGYRAEVGSYPESLAELCPKYFKTEPMDLFTAEPIDYRRVENGYRLYSAGPLADKDYEDILIQVPPVKEVEEEPAPAEMRRRIREFLDANN